MKIWKLLVVALMCVALTMSLIACTPNEPEEGEKDDSFWENLWDGILDTFTGEDNNGGDSETPETPSGDEEPTPPTFQGGDGVSSNDAYPDYGQEIVY